MRGRARAGRPRMMARLRRAVGGIDGPRRAGPTARSDDVPDAKADRRRARAAASCRPRVTQAGRRAAVDQRGLAVVDARPRPGRPGQAVAQQPAARRSLPPGRHVRGRLQGVVEARLLRPARRVRDSDRRADDAQTAQPESGFAEDETRVLFKGVSVLTRYLVPGGSCHIEVGASRSASQRWIDGRLMRPPVLPGRNGHARPLACGARCLWCVAMKRLSSGGIATTPPQGP